MRGAIAAVWVLGLVGAAEARSYRVQAGELVVRAAPQAGAAEVGRVTAGQAYPGTGLQDGWRRIQLSDRMGWVRDAGLRPADFQVKDVVSSAAPVRGGPGRDYRVVGRLDRGDPVAVVGREGDWAMVFHAGRRAFVWAEHLEADPARRRSAAGFIPLAASGPGFYGTTADSRRWGTPRLVYAMERIGLTLAREGRQRMGVGDVSFTNGGPIDGHVSHQHGVDVDIRLARRGSEGPGTRFSAAYDRPGTTRLLVLFRREVRVQYIFFNDPTAIAAGLSSRWPNHDDHFHVRVY